MTGEGGSGSGNYESIGIHNAYVRTSLELLSSLLSSFVSLENLGREAKRLNVG